MAEDILAKFKTGPTVDLAKALATEASKGSGTMNNKSSDYLEKLISKQKAIGQSAKISF